MPLGIGWPELIVLLIIALIVFGPKRLPEMGRSLGKGIREFRSSLGGDKEDGGQDAPPPQIEGADSEASGSEKAEPVAHKRP